MNDPSAIAPLLSARHVRDLKHLSTMCLFGWENFDEWAQDLDEWGLIHGEWMGRLEHPARPMWRITELGRKVLALRS